MRARDTAGAPPVGHRRYIRSDSARLLLKLVRLVRLDINCKRLARTRLLVAARACVWFFFTSPADTTSLRFFFVSNLGREVRWAGGRGEGRGLIGSHEDHLSAPVPADSPPIAGGRPFPRNFGTKCLCCRRLATRIPFERISSSKLNETNDARIKPDYLKNLLVQMAGR